MARCAALALLAALALGASCKPKPKAVILVYGDSLSAMQHGWPRAADARASVVLLAASGERSQTGLAKLDATLDVLTGPAIAPKVLFLMWGTADAIHGTSFADDVVALAAGRAPRVVVGIPPPIFRDEAEPELETIRETLRAEAASHGVTVVDFHALFDGRPERFPDDVHWDEQGQAEAWYAIAAAAGID